MMKSQKFMMKDFYHITEAHESIMRSTINQDKALIEHVLHFARRTLVWAGKWRVGNDVITEIWRVMDNLYSRLAEIEMALEEQANIVHRNPRVVSGDTAVLKYQIDRLFGREAVPLSAEEESELDREVKELLREEAEALERHKRRNPRPATF